MSKPNGHEPHGSVLATFLKALGEHEAREIERHAEVLKRLDQARELFLRGRDETKRLEARVKALEDWKRSMGEVRT